MGEEDTRDDWRMRLTASGSLPTDKWESLCGSETTDRFELCVKDQSYRASADEGTRECQREVWKKSHTQETVSFSSFTLFFSFLLLSVLLLLQPSSFSLLPSSSFPCFSLLLPSSLPPFTLHSLCLILLTFSFSLLIRPLWFLPPTELERRRWEDEENDLAVGECRYGSLWESHSDW